MSPAGPRRGMLPVACLGLLWMVPGLLLSIHLRHLGMQTRIGGAMHVTLLLFLLLACLLPFAFAPAPRYGVRLLRLAIASLLATVQFVLVFFYGIVLLAVHSWQSMPSFEVIQLYMLEWRSTLGLVGLSGTACGLMLLSCWLALLCLYFALAPPLLNCLQRWPSLLRRRFLLTLGLLLLLYAVSQPQWRDREPVHILWSRNNLSMMIPPGMLLAKPQGELSQLPPPGPAFAPRNLVLITVDALRSDQMNVYGAPLDDTPFLSSLFRAGKLQRIDSVYSVCTYSLCGLTAMQSSSNWDQLTARPLVLADVLQRYGYQTFFLMSGDHTHFYGLNRLFGSNLSGYHDGSSIGHGHTNDDNNIVPWLKAIPWSSQRPTFLNIHLMSVHFIGFHDPAFARWQPQQISIDTFLSHGDTLIPYRNHYWNGVLQADDTLRRIFDLLRRQNVLDSAYIIITADHGEFLGEHGLYSHGHQPYEPVVRAPLLIYDPYSTAPYPPRPLTGLIDIAPTLLQVIHAPIPSSWSGIPLQLPTTRNVLSLDSYEAAGIVAQLGTQRYKYLRDRKSGRESLFALGPDPAESNNLASDPAAHPLLLQLRALFEQAHPSAAHLP